MNFELFDTSLFSDWGYNIVHSPIIAWNALVDIMQSPTIASHMGLGLLITIYALQIGRAVSKFGKAEALTTDNNDSEAPVVSRTEAGVLFLGDSEIGA